MFGLEVVSFALKCVISAVFSFKGSFCDIKKSKRPQSGEESAGRRLTD